MLAIVPHGGMLGGTMRRCHGEALEPLEVAPAKTTPPGEERPLMGRCPVCHGWARVIVVRAGSR